MKQIIIFLMYFSLIGCRTSSRLVEKSQTAESVKIETKETKNEVDKIEFDWEKYLSDLNFKFNGATNEDVAEVELSKTDTGIKITAKGRGEITSSVKQEKSSIKQEKIKEKEAIVQAEFNHTKQAKTVEKQVKTNVFSAWIYLFFFLFICFLILLWWFFGRPKELKKE